MQPNILIADDHIMISKGLRKSMEMEFGYTDVYSVTSCSEILKELKKKIYTHIILDMGLSDGSALEILPTIKSLYPELRIMIFSAKSAAAYQKALRHYGIHNYLSKEEDESQTLVRLREFFYNEKVSSPQEDASENPFSTLTAREMEIFHYILQGMGSAEIGKILNLKLNTVSTLKGRMLEKTNTRNIKELCELAVIYNVT